MATNLIGIWDFESERNFDAVMHSMGPPHHHHHGPPGGPPGHYGPPPPGPGGPPPFGGDHHPPHSPPKPTIELKQLNECSV
jgi:hypothetical protein